MNKEEILKKCEYYTNQKLIGLFIIQERKLHDSICTWTNCSSCILEKGSEE